MAKQLLLSLMGVVLLSFSQGMFLSESGANSKTSSSRGDFSSNVVDTVWDNLEDAVEAMSDNEVVESMNDNVNDVIEDMNENDLIEDMNGNDVIEDMNDVIEDRNDNDVIEEMNDNNDNDLIDSLVDVVDDVMEGEELTGFPLEDLDDEELNALMDAEDDIFTGQLDMHIAKQLFLENKALTSPGVKGHGRRRKRIAPLIGRAAFMIGRTLFRKFARGGVTRSGSRVTRHYQAPGSYQSALRDFQRMKPKDVTSFSGRVSGQTGRVGNYRVTVRDGSTKGQSRPTLSVSSHGGRLVRKFRYNQE